MNFLLDCGISEEALKKILLNNSEQMVDDAEWNIERVVSSINYLKEIGIEVVDKILINRFDIVLRGKEELEKDFDKLNLKQLVEMINKDTCPLFKL